MIRLHRGSASPGNVPQYKSGKWIWNTVDEVPEFDAVQERVSEEFIITGGYKFRKHINELEENIFCQEFQREETTHDADVILLSDIKDLVLFLAPSEIITKTFISFIYTTTSDKLLHALIIYFEYFLKFVEYILIRRDEVTGEKRQMQSEQSMEIKRIWSAHLQQYRLLIAREYSKIICGEGEMEPFYHMSTLTHISRTTKDKELHEMYLAFCTQIVWIAMHRRAYDTIDAEMNRLFRSAHFSLVGRDKHNFSHVEQSMLYGKNNKITNFRRQTSALKQEQANVDPENLPIMWIGVRKYRGNDLRILQMELEFIVPSSQLNLIDVSHGILGHPKKLYNTMLDLDWEAVRFQNYSETYDPYRIVRQPTITIPELDETEIRKNSETYEMYYQVVDTTEKESIKKLRKWMQRDEHIAKYTEVGMIKDITMRCEEELERASAGPTAAERVQKFVMQKEKLRKK